MLNNYLDHTDREEDWFQGFRSLMECKKNETVKNEKTMERVMLSHDVMLCC